MRDESKIIGACPHHELEQPVQHRGNNTKGEKSGLLHANASRRVLSLGGQCADPPLYILPILSSPSAVEMLGAAGPSPELFFEKLLLVAAIETPQSSSHGANQAQS